MAKKKSASEVLSTSRVRTKKSDGSVDLSPLESRVETVIFERHEDVLHLNYDIPLTVRMFYQNPETRALNGGDVTLFERMFMAGLRLPFLEIARDFVLFLMVTPSQILLNTWRYLFASYILWRLVLEKEMKILQFFNIYRPRQTVEGMIKLAVWHPAIFIKLKSELTNNKFWEQQFFWVSGEWECPEGTVLPENRRMPRTWRLLWPDRYEPPSINITDQEDVKRMCDWTEERVKAKKFEKIDFNTLVTDKTMRWFLGYTIPENKKTITKRGAIKKKGEAPQSLRQATKKRPSKPNNTNPGEVPQKKKQAIPLAASGARRTPSKSPTPETNTEEGSVSFRGFVPEASLNRGTGASQPFHLRDEISSGASHNGSEVNLGHQDAPGATNSDL
jgi:hypothetical protein